MKRKSLKLFGKVRPAAGNPTGCTENCSGEKAGSENLDSGNETRSLDRIFDLRDLVEMHFNDPRLGPTAVSSADDPDPERGHNRQNGKNREESNNFRAGGCYHALKNTHASDG